MQYRIGPGHSIRLRIHANQQYSEDCLLTRTGETYQVTYDETQRWTDFFVHTTPKGFCNPLANLFGIRVNGVKCFCLCGIYNKKEHTAFGMMQAQVFTSPGGTLHFFANDSPFAYRNNYGSIEIKIAHIRSPAP